MRFATDRAFAQQAPTAATVPEDPSFAPLHEAIAANMLQGEGKQPFHLAMKFQLFNLAGKPQEAGTLDYWWAGPQGFALTIESPSIGTVHNVRLREVTDDKARRSLYLVNELLDGTRNPSIRWSKKDTKLVSEQQNQGGAPLNCMRAEPLDGGHPGITYDSLCVDPANGTIRVKREPSLLLVRNKLGTFAGTKVALEDSLFLCDRLAIQGHVDTLRGFDPSQMPDGITLIQPDPEHSTPSSVAVPGRVLAGKLMKQVQPIYPTEALRQRIAGTVLLHATVSDAGTVTDLFPVASSNDLLTAAAIDAVKRWTYKPYLLNDVPTPVDTTITVNFNISRVGNRS